MEGLAPAGSRRGRPAPLPVPGGRVPGGAEARAGGGGAVLRGALGKGAKGVSVRTMTAAVLVLGAFTLGMDWMLESMEVRPKGIVEGLAQSAHVPAGPRDSIEALVMATGCPKNFFLAWTTEAENFSLRYRRTVESTLKFHPAACLFVYSPTLPPDYFQNFWDLGYNVIVVRPDVHQLLRGTPAEAWLDNLDKWKNGKYFFSHITEIIRLATLYKYGGVYLDTDVIVMRELDKLRNCLGTELAGAHGEAKILNGAVLIFDKGSRFVWEGMVEFNTTYRIDSWGWNGPELVTRVAARFDPNSPDLKILPTIAFYPIHWAVVKKFFTLKDMKEQHKVWMNMRENTYLFHYWNKVTKKLVPEPGSLMYKVLNNYCLFCNETSRDDGLPIRLR